MLDYKRYLLAIALWALALNPSASAFAASSNLFPMSQSGALPIANQFFYCPVVSGATTGTELKCTAAQIAAYNYSLMSGDCTASGTGAIVCTKTNAVAFSGLATLAGSTAGDIVYWNGTSWTRLAGNTGSTNILQETASGVPSWVANAGSAAIPTVAKTSAFTMVSGDIGTLFQVTNTTTGTLPALSVGAGWNAAVINGDATATTTITSPAGTIFSGGTSSSSVTLSPGQTMVFTMNAAVSGWLGTTGPAGPTGTTGAAGTNGAPGVTGPNLIAGIYYVADPTAVAAAISVAAITTAYCAPTWIGAISGGSGTLGNLFFRLGVAGTTTEQAAVYTNDTSKTPNRPLTLLGNSAAISTTTGQPSIPITLSTGLSANTMYWVCLQAGDTTFKYLPVTSAVATGFSAYSRLVGSTISLGSASVTGVRTTVSSYGTWPSSLTAATFIEDNQEPFLQFEFSSVP